MPADAAYAMSRVESEADRMSHLVEDLLLLARLDSGPDLDLQPIDLTELVVNAVSDARAAGPDHVWRLSLPDEPVVGAGRPAPAAPGGGQPAGQRPYPHPARHRGGDRRLGRGRARRVITVTDNGPGIPPDIAGPGLRALHPGRRQPGAHRRARPPAAAPASAWPSWPRWSRPTTAGSRCSSEPGQTRFTVSLPLAEVTAPIPDSGPRPARWTRSHLVGRRPVTAS